MSRCSKMMSVNATTSASATTKRMNMMKKTAKKKPSKGKVEKVMSEYKTGKLHSGKPGAGKGGVVKSKDQAIAIALNSAGKSSKKK